MEGRPRGGGRLSGGGDLVEGQPDLVKGRRSGGATQWRGNLAEGLPALFADLFARPVCPLSLPVQFAHSA